MILYYPPINTNIQNAKVTQRALYSCLHALTTHRIWGGGECERGGKKEVSGLSIPKKLGTLGSLANLSPHAYRSLDLTDQAVDCPV